jgi:N-methylhydantoinase B/oxoprolinase/acetone carboxylase alpha subunit
VESVTVPKGLIKDLYAGLAQVEEVLATLEELMDKEGLERIRRAEEEYRKGEYITAQSSSEIKKLLSD